MPHLHNRIQARFGPFVVIKCSTTGIIFKLCVNLLHAKKIKPKYRTIIIFIATGFIVDNHFGENKAFAREKLIRLTALFIERYARKIIAQGKFVSANFLPL